MNINKYDDSNHCRYHFIFENSSIFLIPINNMQPFLNYLSKIHLTETIALLFTSILIAFSFMFSCSDEGDDFQTFLEKNDGTEWILLNDDLTVYIRLNKNKLHLIEQWSYNKESECYEYNPNIFSPGDFEIKENSIDKLVIQGDVILSDYEFMTFSREDNTLRVVIKLCEGQEETIYFKKSLLRVDEFRICVITSKNTVPFYTSFKRKVKKLLCL